MMLLSSKTVNSVDQASRKSTARHLIPINILDVNIDMPDKYTQLEHFQTEIKFFGNGTWG